MKSLPRTNNPLVVRTDFEHQDAWETICNLIRAPVTALGVTFHAQVQFLEDAELRGLATRDLLARLPRDYEHPTMFVVDTIATTPPDYPILIIDLGEEFGRTFRAIPSAIQGIENNLSIANMGFSEFAAATDKDGIFRGFPAP